MIETHQPNQTLKIIETGTSGELKNNLYNACEHTETLYSYLNALAGIKRGADLND